MTIPSRRGDVRYFDEVGKKIAQAKGIRDVKCNPVTGSVLCLGQPVDVIVVAKQGEAERLFHLEFGGKERGTLSQKFGHALKSVDKEISHFTTGDLDLPSLAFLTLLGVGVYQLIRGNFPAPPWYTAFWYAFGVFSKTVADGLQEKKGKKGFL